jgi:hypothetical protein
MSTDDGLKIDHAAGVVLRDAIRKHMSTFAFSIRYSRIASASVVAVYVDGLAGAIALTIAGRHASKEDVVNATLAKLREAIDRDLQHLGKSYADKR